MKKSIICGIASLAMAATPVFSAFAEAPQAGAADGYFMGSKDATVGEVDETIYSVDIAWGDMAFDWKYNPSINKFEFVGKQTCAQIGLGATPETSGGDIAPILLQTLFEDNTCNTPFSGVLEDKAYYHKYTTGGTIDVADNSTNGKIKAQASFTPETKYSWATGKFSSHVYLQLDNTFSQDLEDNYLIPSAGTSEHVSLYSGMLYLVGDDAHITSESVVANDKIGTITINIEPDLN